MAAAAVSVETAVALDVETVAAVGAGAATAVGGAPVAHSRVRAPSWANVLAARARPVRSLACVVATACIAAASHAALPAPEAVSFPSLDAGVTVTGLLYRPLSSSQRVPVIVGLHGCGGMWSAGPDGRDRLNARSVAWTQRFLAQGYAVLWPDSFNPRGKHSVCAIPRGEPSITPSQRGLDALGALAFVAAQAGLDASRVALVGWSHGGSTVLAAVNGKDARVAGFRASGEAATAPRAAVAFYPGCGVASRMREGWLPAVPLAIFSGALDDWSSTPTCERLTASARGRGANMSITVYPNAHHGFDAPGTRLVHRTDVTRGVDAGKGVTAGPDPVARAAVEVAVPAFLQQYLKGP